MDVNLLAVSVGNTRTRLGAFSAGKLVRVEAVPNDQPAVLETASAALLESLADLDNPQVLLASVNPAQEEVVERVVSQRWKQPLLRAERDVPIPIGRQLDPHTLVGEDRLLNAAAAYDVLKQACVIVDAGTAITVDFVDGAGTFHGGAIGPGARMMLASLHQHTALLPEIDMARPLEPVGHNTAEAMRSAVFHGLRGMVRELVEQYAEAAGAYPLVVATGGDAELLFADFPLVERLVPDLTLLGLAVTLRTSLADES
ncbi:MAG: type III pantothenate kinase [Phycisphaeraceae bacterium]|nr:type III pantothenate kinase [Phycisphaeraceae bacterium]